MVQFPGVQDKRTRALQAAERSESGRYHVEDTPVGRAFIREHDRFPDKNDDCVDVSSVATHHFGLHEEIEVLFRKDRDETDLIQERIVQRELIHLSSLGRAGY